MTIRASTLRKVSLNQPGGATPRPVPAQQRGTGIRPSDISTQTARQDQTGQLVGESLSALGEFARRVEQRQDEIETTRFTTELEKQTAALATQAFEGGDASKAPQRFLELHKETTNSLMEQIEDQDVKLQIQTLAGRQRASQFAQVVREVDRQQKQAFGNEIASRLELKQQQYAGAETKQEREAAQAEIERLVKTKQREGIEPLTDEGVKLQTRQLAQEATAVRADNLIAQERFDEADALVERADLDPSQQATLRNRLRSRREAFAGDSLRRMKDQLDLAILTNGRQGVEGVAAEGQTVAAHGNNDDAKEAEALVETARAIPGFADKSLSDMRRELVRLNNETETVADRQKLQTLSRIAQRKQSRFNQLPIISASQSLGADLPAFPEDTSDTQALESFFEARVPFAEEAEKQVGGAVNNSQGPLTKTEAANLAQLTRPNQDPAPLINTMVAAQRALSPERFSALTEQMGVEDAAVEGAFMVAGTGVPDIAETVIRGQQVRNSDLNVEVEPTAGEIGLSTAEVLQDSIDNTLQPLGRSGMQETALAYAHARFAGDGRLTRGEYEKSLRIVMGEGEDGRGSATVEINDAAVWNPSRELDGPQVLDRWRGSTIEDLMRHRAEGVEAVPMMDRGDGVPSELDNDNLREVVPRVHNPTTGTYWLEASDGEPIKDNAGNTYLFNFRDLVLDPTLTDDEIGAAEAAAREAEIMRSR